MTDLQTRTTAAQIVDRGFGAAVATPRAMEVELKTAEWHLAQAIELGAKLAQVDASRREIVVDEAVRTVVDQAIGNGVRNALNSADRAQAALTILVRHRGTAADHV